MNFKDGIYYSKICIDALIYELGANYIDYEWLIIKLDNGIVIDYDFGLT